MAKLIISPQVLLLLALMVVYSQGGAKDLIKVSPWTVAIWRKLCEPEGHPDDVAQEFFDCYQESVTPGGSKLVECQEQVYHVTPNNETNVDKLCASRRDQLPEYVACAMRKLITSRNRPSETMAKLNECQGAVLNVTEPSSIRSMFAS